MVSESSKRGKLTGHVQFSTVLSIRRGHCTKLSWGKALDEMCCNGWPSQGTVWAWSDFVCSRFQNSTAVAWTNLVVSLNWSLALAMHSHKWWNEPLDMIHVNKSCRIQLSKYFNSWEGMKEYTKVPSRVLTSYASFCAGRRWQLGSSIFGASHKGRWDRC